MKEGSRVELLSLVEDLLAHYCKGCFLHEHFKNEGGRRKAHRFCISQCTVGEKLQTYGKMLK